MTLERDYTAGDRVLMHLQRALRVSAGPTPRSAAYPGAPHPEQSASDAERAHAAGLMRVNHAGEVSAQALYLGQAAVARDTALREHLMRAAAQEQDHLAWCAERLAELGSAPSRFDAAWFAGAWTIGALAGLAGDRTSLGFVVETERQVEAHLGEHLLELPEDDARSRAVVARMQADEARHGQEASEAGAAALPEPVPRAMALAAAVMKWVAYRI
ncbi:MAG TPA: 2-polyprenyl-3-methyl-6-methoxy-1,4-benzoquinone monooxygenase [Candidatus Saccharimonadia bacterium]|nr:2-polyprenyl-3-methyl-6-methoxy-1,4-benzoquinone monooxygenase [Candidatus Saccharimonadia bacterium]